MFPPQLSSDSCQYFFTVDSPFATVAAAIDSLGTLIVLEADELHVLAEPLHGGVLCARPTYPDSVQVIVAENREGLVAQEYADVLSALLGRRASSPSPAVPPEVQPAPG
jgi:hypothetical protein